MAESESTYNSGFAAREVCHSSFYAMGTRCHLVFPGIDSSLADQLFQVIKHEINRVESVLSRFIPYSEISLINRNAAREPVQVSEEVFGILKKCLEYHETTAGAFDITLRPVMQYWKNKQANIESDHQLYRLLDETGARQIVLDDQARTVYLPRVKLEIDLGGFGKGYALERIRKLLGDFNIENAFISFGESSILTLGCHPAGDHWKIGINNYREPGRGICTFAMNDGSVSTSSNFYVDDAGKLHNHRHVINPFTGYPVEDLMTVSVRSDSPVQAEILSTAFLVLSDAVIDTICNEIPECEVIKINYTGGQPPGIRKFNPSFIMPV